LIGGETAEMPGLYQSGDYDLAGFSLGAVERNAILPRKDIAAGDILLGLASDGVHSNGFSLVRRIVDHSGLNWQDSAPYAPSDTTTLAESLLTPTRIYVKPVLQVLQNNSSLKALCHITGGGFPENLPRVLPDELSAEVNLASWSLPPVFGWLQQTGNIATAELLRTFNCGIGMVLVVKADEAETISGLLTAQGETVIEIGHITPRDNQAVVLHGGFNNFNNLNNAADA
jgi:phosphoribosylformylglycinamidine cyclo-ligase